MTGQRCKPNPMVLDGISALSKQFKRAKERGDTDEAVQCLVSLGTITKLTHESPLVHMSHFMVAYDLSGKAAAKLAAEGKHAEAADRYAWISSFARDRLGDKEASAAGILASSAYSKAAEAELKRIKTVLGTSQPQPRLKVEIIGVARMLRTAAAIGAESGVSREITDSQLNTSYRLFMDQGERFDAMETVARMGRKLRRSKFAEIMGHMKYHVKNNLPEEDGLLEAFENQQNRILRNVYTKTISADSFELFANLFPSNATKRMVLGMAIGCLCEAANDLENSMVWGRLKRSAEYHNRIAMMYESLNDPRSKRHYGKEAELLELHERIELANAPQQLIRVLS